MNETSAQPNIALKPADTRLRDMGIALTASAIPAVYYYGRRALVLALVCVSLSLVCHAFLRRISGKKAFSGLSGGYVCGMMMFLALPVSVPLNIAAFGVTTAAVTAAILGLPDDCAVSPNSAAILLISYCFPRVLIVFVPVFTELPVTDYVVPDETVNSFFGSLITIGITPYTTADLFSGRLAFTLGGGCVVMLCAAALLLLLRRTVSFSALLSFIVSYLLAAFLFIPRSGTVDLPKIFIFSLSGVLFPLLFAVLPQTGKFLTHSSKAAYGLIAGFLCGVFAFVSKTELAGWFCAAAMSPLAVYFSEKHWTPKVFLPKSFFKIKLSRLD
ncbi:MAG: RnfABCDGE type electron transport complex subunit D [Ruminococcus sp.]|jgi:electron transport complex protein RnfD|nr:RnfABCDGE type electron transport complex subunit D [Ruminococcus sp.]